MLSARAPTRGVAIRHRFPCALSQPDPEYPNDLADVTQSPPRGAGRRSRGGPLGRYSREGFTQNTAQGRSRLERSSFIASGSAGRGLRGSGRGHKEPAQFRERALIERVDGGFDGARTFGAKHGGGIGVILGAQVGLGRGIGGAPSGVRANRWQTLCRRTGSRRHGRSGGRGNGGWRGHVRAWWWRARGAGSRGRRARRRRGVRAGYRHAGAPGRRGRRWNIAPRP